MLYWWQVITCVDESVFEFALEQRAHAKSEELLSLFAKEFVNSTEAAVNRGEILRRARKGVRLAGGGRTCVERGVRCRSSRRTHSRTFLCSRTLTRE